ncbi:uncharacterized protein PSFLO_03372 [Pseudozyma flocculosa]|uniref:Glycosyl transferase CAP10 domain-containing protein n=1 Tax=Pseudozyma flocculosa TaxID=84751 RepID=A0A5C3F1K1_9BASI|nr:uncharacterized protein PSFLO_03372 [Pseudozyma flocculosa]
MASSSTRYERVPASADEGGRRRSHSSGGGGGGGGGRADSMVTKFGRYSYLATAGFIAFCFACTILPLSSVFVGLGWMTRPGLLPKQQIDKTMDDKRCLAEFPALYPQLEDNVKAWKLKGGIGKADVDKAHEQANRNWGLARRHRLWCLSSSTDSRAPSSWLLAPAIPPQVVVKNGRVYIREVKEGNESRMSALLHILHTAVTTDPSASTRGSRKPLPDVDLVISTADKDGNSSPAGWVIDKRVDEDPSIGRWLFPDFGFAGWPEAGIASYEEFTRLIQKEEREYPWANKDDRAFWRGLANWYPVRKDLLSKTSLALDPGRASWADVRETSFHDKGDQFAPIVPMHEHCRRKYLIQSEGNSYSGRFKYLLACNSVSIAHPLEWTQHFHPALNSNNQSRQQNFVELSGPLFEGLEDEVKRLQTLDRGGAARAGGNSPRRIAENAQRTLKERECRGASVATWPKLKRCGYRCRGSLNADWRCSSFHMARGRYDAGYLTPAATMCYTRAALRAYASVLDVATWGQDGVDLETGPHPLEGGGVVASGGKGKDLAKLGAKGDIEYGVWRLSGSIDWPPRATPP